VDSDSSRVRTRRASSSPSTISATRFRATRSYPQANRSPKALVLPPAEIKKAGIKRQLQDGDVVSAEFIDWPDADAHPNGRPIEVVARRGDTDLELRLIALSRGLPLEFPREVTKAAERLKLPSPAKAAKSRRDLRKTTCFTIDPDTAKDFDDAVSIRQRADGLIELGVHIADVSYFVEPDDTIDKEAWERGTSVYLVDTVLPMLPEHLSNGLCSLVPGEPRLAMSVIAALDSTGAVKDVEFCESLIESKRRFTYGEAEAIIHGKEDPLAAEIHLLHLLTQTLHQRHLRSGSTRTVCRSRCDRASASPPTAWWRSVCSSQTSSSPSISSRRRISRASTGSTISRARATSRRS